MPIEKRNNRPCTACHGQCTDSNDAAAEKSNKDTCAVAENTAPFVGNMAVAAVFEYPRNGIIWAKTDIGTKVKGNTQTGDEDTGDQKTNAAGYSQRFGKADGGK